MPPPKVGDTSTVALFASVEGRVREVKEDLGKRLDELTKEVGRLADGLVRKEVLDAELRIRDDRIRDNADDIKRIEALQVRQEGYSKALRTGLVVTAFAAALAIASRFIPSL